MGKKRVVIVEDENLIADSLEKKLINLQFQVDEKFRSGKEALEYIFSSVTAPDLILMDIVLDDGEDGIEIASEIQKKTDIPIIFLSALNDKKTIQRAASAAKPFNYLVKPFSEPELRTTIEVAFQRADLEWKLKESEKRYKIISELSSDFAYAARLYSNGHYKVEWVTDAVTGITGYSVEEIIKGIDYKKLLFQEDMKRIRRYAETMVNGKATALEFRIVSKKGAVRWIRNKAKAEYNGITGSVTRIYGAVEDITELKRIEQIEKSKEQSFQGLIKRMNDGVIIIDKEGIITFVNDLICSLSGFEKYELIGEHIDSITERADSTLPENAANEVPYETICRTKDGGTVNVLVSPKVLHDGKGEFAGSFSVVTNIDKQKEKEYFLRRQREVSKAQYENIFENTTVGLVEEDLSEVERLIKEKAKKVKDLPKYFKRYPQFTDQLLSAIQLKNINKAALSLLKVKDALEYKERLPDMIHPEAIDFFRNGLIELLNGSRQITAEIPLYDGDGNLLFVNADLSLPENSEGIKNGILSLVDVTDLNRRRKSELQMERKFRSLFTEAPFGIAFFDKDGGLNDMNDAFRKTWKISLKKERTLLKNYFLFQDPHPVLQEHWDLIKKAFAGNIIQIPATEFIPKRGQINSLGGNHQFWFRGYFFPVEKGVTNTGEIGFIVENITDIKKAEEDLRNHEKMYKLIFNSSPEVIAVSDENRNIVYVSDKSKEMFRVTSKRDVVGKSILTWISNEEQTRAIENVKNVYQGESVTNTYILSRSDKTKFTAEISSTTITDSSGKFKNMVSIIREISEPASK